MTTREIMAGLLEELPVPEPVEHVALLEDEVLPYSLALLEPGGVRARVRAVSVGAARGTQLSVAIGRWSPREADQWVARGSAGATALRREDACDDPVHSLRPFERRPS